MAHRGVTIAAVAVIERLLIPAATWAVFWPSRSLKVLLPALLAASVAARTFLQRASVVKTDAELVERSTASVLDGDVTNRSVLPNEDAHAELLQGIFQTSRLLAQDLPVLAADVAVACVLAVAVVLVAPAPLLSCAMALALVGGAVLAWSRQRMRIDNDNAWQLQQRVIVRLVDALEGRLEIVASGLRDAFVKDTTARARDWRDASKRIATMSVVSGRLPLIFVAAAVALMVVLGSHRLETLPVTTADLALLASVTPAFMGVAQGLQSTLRAERWLAIVAGTIAEARSQHADRPRKPDHGAPIIFDNVCFRYDRSSEGAFALQNVSFSWPSASVMALTGRNGSGKSTCLNLLLALAAPTRGSIRINAESLEELDLDEWRQGIAFLPQRPYLPPRSDVRSAIRLFAPDATDTQQRRALDRVGVLRTLGAAGCELDAAVDSLSVGQRQRVALARLLCRDATMWVLDEPDANLDREGIELVAHLISELKRSGRRVLLAAHSSELLAVADKVVRIEVGRVLSEPAA
jgi:ABC-type transport system involved in cytochrome bd biosynthesis fused ATPase/permease subunit